MLCDEISQFLGVYENALGIKTTNILVMDVIPEKEPVVPEENKPVFFKPDVDPFPSQSPFVTQPIVPPVAPLPQQAFPQKLEETIIAPTTPSVPTQMPSFDQQTQITGPTQPPAPPKVKKKKNRSQAQPEVFLQPVQPPQIDYISQANMPIPNSEQGNAFSNEFGEFSVETISFEPTNNNLQETQQTSSNEPPIINNAQEFNVNELDGLDGLNDLFNQNVFQSAPTFSNTPKKTTQNIPFLDIDWLCPVCRNDASGTICSFCGYQKPNNDAYISSVAQMLPSSTPNMPPRPQSNSQFPTQTIQKKETWICEQCGNTNNSKFCSECGTIRKVKQVKTHCPNCGWQPDDLNKLPKFCPDCGLKY
jgi:hypothetical protein